MEKNDLDSFQNIANPKQSRSPLTNATNPSARQPKQLQQQLPLHQQLQREQHQSQMYETQADTAYSQVTWPKRTGGFSWPQVCQICGVYLKIDPNIINMSEATYKQLSSGGGGGGTGNEQFETTLCSGGGGCGVGAVTSLDTDIELSMTATTAALGVVTGSSNAEASSMMVPSQTSPPLVPDDLEDDILIDSAVEASTQPVSVLPYYRKSIVAQSTSLLRDADLLTGWSKRINETTALFDLMSLNTAIDHPLCEECADLLVNQLDAQCKLVEMEYADYAQLIARLNQQANSDVEIERLEKELSALDVEEKEVLEKLQDAEKEKRKQEREKEERLAEEASLLQQEQTYLLEYSNLKRQLIKLEEKQESLDNQLQTTKFHFNRLRTVNVLNAAFHIWHSGPFGTINFFRLGRLPGVQVEWDEINAGLGQANLLLYCLANRMGQEFKRYRLVPNGSYSYIEVVEPASAGHEAKIVEELNMYRLKGYKYYFDWDKKFEKGMTAFLDCLKQLEEKIMSIDHEFSLPYKINQHKLEDKNGSSYSIKFQLNSFEEWTKALKYMLTNLKWSLAWVISNEK